MKKTKRKEGLFQVTTRLDQGTVDILEEISRDHDRDRSWAIRWLAKSYLRPDLTTGAVVASLNRAAEDGMKEFHRASPDQPVIVPKGVAGLRGLEVSELEIGLDATHAAFDRFWEPYPRKVGKGAALKLWLRMKRSEQDDAEEASRSYGVAMRGAPDDRKRYIPHPAMWLSQRRWEDDPKEWKAAAGAPPEPTVPEWKPTSPEDAAALEAAKLGDRR